MLFQVILLFKPITYSFNIFNSIYFSVALLSNIEGSYNPLNILANKQNDFIRLAEIFDAGSSFKMLPIQPNLISLIKSIPYGIINGFFRPLSH